MAHCWAEAELCRVKLRGLQRRAEQAQLVSKLRAGRQIRQGLLAAVLLLQTVDILQPVTFLTIGNPRGHPEHRDPMTTQVDAAQWCRGAACRRAVLDCMLSG